MATLGLSRCRTVRSCAEATSVSARATAARAPRDTANSTACCLVTGCWLRATAERNHTRTVARTRESIRKFTPRREDKLGGARPIPSPRTHPFLRSSQRFGGNYPSIDATGRLGNCPLAPYFFSVFFSFASLAASFFSVFGDS